MPRRRGARCPPAIVVTSSPAESRQLPRARTVPSRHPSMSSERLALVLEGTLDPSTSSVGGTYEPTVPGGEGIAGEAARGSQGAREPTRDRQGTVAGTGITARAAEVGPLHQRGAARADRRAQSICVAALRDERRRRADGHSRESPR